MGKKINLDELAIETIDFIIGGKEFNVPADPLLPVQTKINELLTKTKMLMKKLENESVKSEDEQNIDEILEINKKLTEYNVEAAYQIIAQDKDKNIDKEFVENNLSLKQIGKIIEAYLVDTNEIEQAKNSKSPQSQPRKKKSS